MADLQNNVKKKKKMKKQTVVRVARILVQIVCFLIAPAMFSQAFSGLKNMLTAIGTGTPLEWSSFTVKLVALLCVTIVFGRIFCGWACAFGALNDWVYQIVAAITKKLGIKLPQIPERARILLQKVKYLVLFLVLLLCFTGKGSLVTTYSPWTVFSMLTAGNFAIGNFAVSGVILLLMMVGMALQERFFCQFICPMGAVFSLMPQLPFFALKRKKSNCPPKCQLCKKNCPVSIKLTETPEREGECIGCLRCMAGCPKKNISIIEKRKTEEKIKVQEA